MESPATKLLCLIETKTSFTETPVVLIHSKKTGVRKVKEVQPKAQQASSFYTRGGQDVPPVPGRHLCQQQEEGTQKEGQVCRESARCSGWVLVNYWAGVLTQEF